MGQIAEEQLETPCLPIPCLRISFFVLAVKIGAKEEMKLAKNGNRTLNYICEGRMYENEQLG